MRVLGADGSITLYGPLDKPQEVDTFNALAAASARQQGGLIIEIVSAGQVVPSVGARLAATCDYYRRLGLTVLPRLSASGVERSRVRRDLSFLDPRAVDDQGVAPYLSGVWHFDDQSASELADRIVNESLLEVSFGQGAHDAFSWSLWEGHG